jgi:hypothetical protein
VALIALVVFARGLFSARLGRADLSAPIIFVTVGLLLTEVLHGSTTMTMQERADRDDDATGQGQYPQWPRYRCPQMGKDGHGHRSEQEQYPDEPQRSGVEAMQLCRPDDDR